MPKILIIEACRQCSNKYRVNDKWHCWEKNGRKINCNTFTEIPSWCDLEEEDNKLRAKWFEKGQMSVKRKNKSGCTCIIDEENGDRITSVCGAHKAWMEEQCQKN